MDKGAPPLNRRIRPENLLIGLGFGSGLTGFFFFLTWFSPGFAQMPAARMVNRSVLEFEK